MVDKPQIESLSNGRRKALFFFLVLVFLVTLPVMIFYTAGYRLDFTDENQTIVPTGGIYITTANLSVDVFVNERQIERPRLFRSAYYIQNLPVGQHRVVVQRPDLQTWVKELPVDPHIVIETSAFNMPVIPQLRPITQFVTATGSPVFIGSATSTGIFSFASSTLPVTYATTSTSSSFSINAEYVFVESLFGTTSTLLQSLLRDSVDVGERFTFATTSAASGVEATTTEEVIIARGNVALVVRDSELYAQWNGNQNGIPYYFCVPTAPTSTVALRYGEHVADEITRLALSTTTPLVVESNRMCRPEIKMNRLQQEIFFYDFFPRSSDLVVLQLEDGLYATEIDDRAWQNTQLLYPGNDFRVEVQNNTIFIKDGEHYFEVVTTIE